MRETYGATASTRVSDRQHHRLRLVPGMAARGDQGDRREPVEDRGGEERDQQDADDELGQAGQGQQHRLDDGVGTPTPVVGRDHRDPEGDRDHHQGRDQHQHQGVDDVAADQLADRQLVGDRGAQVAGQQPAEPVEVAGDEGLVEVQLGRQLSHPGLVGGVVLAEDRPDGVAQRRGGHEHQDRDQPQREHRQPQPACQPERPRLRAVAAPGRGDLVEGRWECCDVGHDEPGQAESVAFLKS